MAHDRQWQIQTYGCQYLAMTLGDTHPAQNWILFWWIFFPDPFVAYTASDAKNAVDRYET